MGTTLTIGKDLTIYSYSTVQKGYGRQGLYLSFTEIDGDHYMQDVYPNVAEHFGILLTNNAFWKDRDEQGRFCKPHFEDANGVEYERTYNSVEDFLNENFKGIEIEIENDGE